MKSDLAILGGKKTIESLGPHFTWPIITENIEKKVVEQLHKSISIYDRSGVFAEFEDEFALYHSRKRALLCSSGTLAIHSMFVAADFKEGDEVICPAYTFFATATPLFFSGAKPVLCESDRQGNIDPEEIKKNITSKTKGVIVTHMWGVPCQMDKIVAICKENNLILMEDCSHAHGASIVGKKVGSFGDMAAWSIQGQKTVSGGEGGVFVTDNDEYHHKAILLGHYNKRCKQEIPETSKYRKYAVTGMGLKYRAHPLAVVIALETFRDLDKNIAVRNKFAKRIISQLNGLPGISMPNVPDGIYPSWYALVFQYKSDELGGLTRERFFEALQAEGLLEVDCPNSTSPLNLLPLFQSPEELFPEYDRYNLSYGTDDFPIAKSFYDGAIKIPVWSEEKDSEIVDLYIAGIKKVINNYKDIL